MKNVFMLAVGLLAVLFLAGCGKSAESDSYYPLTLGSTWTYPPRPNTSHCRQEQVQSGRRSTRFGPHTKTSWPTVRR